MRFEAGNEWTNAHFTDQAFDVLEEAEKMAAEKGCTVSQVALAWVAQQPGVTSPIIGPRTMEQLLDNLGALDVKITDEDRARIDALVPPDVRWCPTTTLISDPVNTAGRKVLKMKQRQPVLCPAGAVSFFLTLNRR